MPGSAGDAHGTMRTMRTLSVFRGVPVPVSRAASRTAVREARRAAADRGLP
ncbi:hypothetical protein GCM10010420_34910 [Streptomyces glaucosporus]|uniref:Uncharacterized protein n=1 Tax=Streptomyces glaucosporus TaxID=284044 RepID=A0ABN3IIH1_9ACTN